MILIMTKYKKIRVVEKTITLFLHKKIENEQNNIVRKVLNNVKLKIIIIIKIVIFILLFFVNIQISSKFSLINTNCYAIDKYKNNVEKENFDIDLKLKYNKHEFCFNKNLDDKQINKLVDRKNKARVNKIFNYGIKNGFSSEELLYYIFPEIKLFIKKIEEENSIKTLKLKW